LNGKRSNPSGAGEATSRDRPWIATPGRGSAPSSRQTTRAHARQACGDRRQALLATRIGAGSQNKSTSAIWRNRLSTASAPISGAVEEKLPPHALAARAVALQRTGWQ
jgi:hypothetical protein